MFNHRSLGNVWVSIRDPVAVPFEDSWCCARGPLGCQQGVPVDFMTFSLLYIQQKYIRCQDLDAWSSHWQTHFWSGFFFNGNFFTLSAWDRLQVRGAATQLAREPNIWIVVSMSFSIFLGPCPSQYVPQASLVQYSKLNFRNMEDV